MIFMLRLLKRGQKMNVVNGSKAYFQVLLIEVSKMLLKNGAKIQISL